MFIFTIFLIPHILNYLHSFCPIFRKCLVFLIANPEIQRASKIQFADYQQYAGFRKFANDWLSILLSGLLRKSPSILQGFTAAKLLIFRKCHKFFRLFLHLRRIFIILFCRVFVKSLIIRLFQKTHFSQMILRFVVSISQRSPCQALYHSNFHRLLLFDWRNVFYAGIAFCTERIDVYPVLSSDDKFGESLAHALILNLC